MAYGDDYDNMIRSDERIIPESSVNISDDDIVYHLVASTVSSLLPNSTTTVFWLSDKCRSFEFVICTVVIGILCVGGMAWNTLAVVVLYRDRHNKVATFLLQVLAMADNAVLLVSLLVLSAVHGPAQNPEIYKYLRYAIPYLKKYINPLGYVTHSVAIWTVVLLAINRFIAVCLPFKAERILTIRNAQIQVLVVIFFSFVVNIPRLFQYDVVWVTNDRNESYPRKRLTAFGSNHAVEIGYFNAFYSIVVLIFPLICLVGFNAKLIYTLQISMRNMKRNSLYYIGSQEKNITFVMIVVIIQVLVCHTPDRIITVFRQVEMMMGKFDMACPHAIVYAQHFANVLIIVNCSTNFFIYYICRVRFRRIFVRRFCPCCADSLGRSDSTASRGTIDSNEAFHRNGRVARLNSGNDALLTPSPTEDERNGETKFFNGVEKSVTYR